jgi:structural maintenance of chromosomes protein 6
MPAQTVNGLGGGRKRSRRTLEDHSDEYEEDILHVDEATSSLRRDNASYQTPRFAPSPADGQTNSLSQGKRARISNQSQGKSRHSLLGNNETPSSEAEDSTSEQENDYSQEDSGEEERSDTPVPATQYEEMRDGGFRHLQFEEEDDQRATQRLQNRSAVLGDNQVAENGILESITCINFMCHTRLHCDLGPLLNFIVGENGSGKSAILTAITLCLGGKASSTNRGGSLKSFVKEGQDQGVLTVKIKNKGLDSYRHDVYGDSIIVERNFSRSGSTGFKVKSVTGRIISNKRSEVEEIVEYYCLQVDNPLNVLSQDNARQFLNAASASMKYKFFIQGVQLEQLDKDYQLVKEFLDANEQKLPEQEERVQGAKRAFDSAEKLLKSIENNQELRRKKRHYTNQLAWAQVVEQERLLTERENKILQTDTRIAEQEHAVEERTQALEESDKRTRTAEEAFAVVERDEVTHQEAVDAARNAFEAVKKELEGIRRDERDIHSSLKGADDQVKQLRQKIASERKRLDDASGDAQKAVKDRHSAAQAQEEDVSRQLDTAVARLPELDQLLASAKEAEAALKPELVRKRGEIQALRQKITSLQQDRGSPYDAFDSRVLTLLKMIANDRGFEEQPIGPIGTHIKVLKPAWSNYLERTLGHILDGFVVTGVRDQRRLQTMMNRLKMPSTIYISSRQRINTAHKEPDPNFDTILRILAIDDDLVRNTLIINNHIEQVLLIEERTRAEDVMFSGAAPRNVAACLTFHDGKRGQALRLTNKGGDNIATTPVIPIHQRPKLKSDVGTQLLVQQELLGQLEADFVSLEGEQRRLLQTAKKAMADTAANQKEIGRLRQQRRQIEGTITKIAEELDKFENADGRLRQLEEELPRALSRKDLFGNQFGEMHVRMEKVNDHAEELRTKLQEEKRSLQDWEARRNKATDKLQALREARHIDLVSKNEAFEELDRCRDDKRVAEEKRERQARRVSEFIEAASKVTPDRVHISEEETYATVEKKLEAITRQLEARNKRLGMTDEQVHAKVVETKQRYETLLQVFEGSSEQISTMKKTLQSRLHKWRLFQRYISAGARTNFIYLLSERGFRGKLLLDHKSKKLQVQVEPDETRRKASGRDTKTLSGGEKSFSSICLLLAIWEAMGSPLRCLDEFDVFMDNVNRAISTEMLVGYLSRITPAYIPS